MPPPTPARRQNGDAVDSPISTYQMHRAYSMDSALNDQDHVNENVIYEVESEAEAQDFLMGGSGETGDCESDTGSSARSRVMTRRKTQPRRVAASKAAAKPKKPRQRKAIREESVDIDIENDFY